MRGDRQSDVPGAERLAPTGWLGRCWRAGWAVRVWWRWWRSAIWIGWLPCLAVFKAGGVYLPIEPHFPADRIAAMLSRAGCGLVLTEPASTATLDQALRSLPGFSRFRIEAGYGEDHADGNLGVERRAGSAGLYLFHVWFDG